jgi:preprotein translocase subunit SecE
MFKTETMATEVAKANSWPVQARSYVEEVKAEMRRVTWPSWPQVRATTGVVIGAVFLFAAYFWVVDGIVNAIVSKILSAAK